MTDKVKLYVVKNDEGKFYDFDSNGVFWKEALCPKLYTLSENEAQCVAHDHGGHVVELTEKQKVKLPQDVGKELDDWMAANQDGLVGRIGDLIDDITTYEPELSNVVDFADDSEENYFKVIDAYRYGWEAEK